jgi:hypothetical protein
MSMMGMQVNMEQAWSRDGGRFVSTKVPMGEQTMGTDGKTAWVKSPMGYQLATEEQTDQMNGQAAMFRMHGKDGLKGPD